MRRSAPAMTWAPWCMTALVTVSIVPVVWSSPTPPPPRNGSTPAVSPDGSRIAFASERDKGQWSMYVVDADGSNAVRLTRSPGIDGPPAWNDRGKRIIFRVSQGDTAMLMSVGTNGEGTRTLVTLVAKSVVLSHDGRHMAYNVGSWSRNRLMLADADGSNTRALTDTMGASYNLAWSPDDRRIAYTHVDALRDMQVWVVNANGTGAHPVTQFPASDGENDGRPQWPAWSPDGRKIAIQAGVYDRQNPMNNTGHIWVIDLSTGAATKLAAHDQRYLDETPSWFPDNKHLAFQSNRTGRMEVWVMGVDGFEARQVTR